MKKIGLKQTGSKATNTTEENKMKKIGLLITSLVCALTIAFSAPVGAQSPWTFPGTFYQATTANTTSVSGGNWYDPNFASPYVAGSTYDPENLWAPDSVTISGYTLTGFFSMDSWQEHCPDLVTTITGLNPTNTYQVYVVQNESWEGGCEINSGFSDSSMTTYTGLCTGAVVDEPSQDVGVIGAVVSSPLGTVTGKTSVGVYVNDGNYGFGTGTRYTGVVLADETPVPEPGSILVLASGLVGTCSILRRRRN